MKRPLETFLVPGVCKPVEIFQWVFCFLFHQGTDLLCVELLSWRSSAAREALQEKERMGKGTLLRCWRKGQKGEGTGKRGAGGESAGEGPDLCPSSEWRTSGRGPLHAPGTFI